MKRSRSTEHLDNHAFTLKSRSGHKLYVGTYKVSEPRPQFRITLEPPDDEAVVYQEITIDQKGNRVALYYYFENVGMVTVQVRMEQIR